MSKRVLIPYRNESKIKPYVEAVRASGLHPVAISVSSQPRMNGYNGLLLTGGTDVHPGLYGETAQPEVDEPDNERDSVEWKLIDETLQADLPLLAICRGMQLLNVHQGGTLIQHLARPKHDTEFEDKGTIAHEVRLEPNSRIREATKADCIQVNSRHHQAVDRLGRGLIISARDTEDQIIEGLERVDRRFVVGVQWHPEDQVFRHPEQMRIFEHFAQACD